jgi:DNA excision repair protein ERCC-6
MRESAFQADRQKLLSQRAALEQDIQDAQRSLDSTMQEMNSISKSSRMDSVHANALNRLTVQRNSLQRRIDFSHSKIQRLNGRIQQLTTEYQREPQTQSNRTVDLLMGDVDNERDRLIRLGEITPFQQMSESSASNHNRHSSTLNAPIPTSVATAPMVGLTGTKRSYAKFAIADDTDNVAYAARMRSTRHQPVAPSVKPEKKHKLGQSGQSRAEAISIDSDKSDSDSSSDSSDESSDESSDAISDESSGESESRRRPVKSESYQFDSESDSQSESSSSLLRSPEDSEVDEASANDDDASDDEAPDIQLDGGLAVPARVHERLFKYQRTGIRWLWELHQQNVGGIIADEMGLGKTVQIVSFLAALHRSNKLRASVIVCPASVMHQWLREFRAWYPSFRVMIMHDSGNHSLTPAALLERVFSDPFAQTRGAVVITTYESVRINEDLFCAHEWGYLVLDEGHKIRNPDAAVTLACKKFLTTHRIIMSGAPIQNNLRELWSLFDFCFPGKLGTLPVFEEEFCTPITLGGYRNASALQVQLAYKCALMLRDIIHPYILRRVKADIRFHLPEKTEQILFCRLSHAQRAEYKRRLASRDVVDAMAARAEGRSIGRSAALRAIDTLRKLCNHPDLLLRESSDRPVDYGNAERSGKLQVVGAVLRAWKAEGHRVLLFAQTRQMLDIIEQYVRQADYEYRRFDGSTSIRARQPMIDEFNTDPNIFLFLLTTRAGGLGVNLTGADRIILFDPDWNPSTDAQARERAYRIGQTKNVVIYRLVTKGTIEEKVYHRQIFKQMLTDRVLKDAQQRRLFSSAEMRDLFSLDDDAPAASGKSHSETHELMQEMQDMTQARQRMVGELEEGEIRPPVEFEITQMPTSTGAESNSGTTKSENKFLDVLFANEQALSGVLSHDQLMEHAHDGGRASAAVLTSKAAQVRVQLASFCKFNFSFKLAGSRISDCRQGTACVEAVSAGAARFECRRAHLDGSAWHLWAKLSFTGIAS